MNNSLIDQLVDKITLRQGPKYYSQKLPSTIDNELLDVTKQLWNNTINKSDLSETSCSFLVLFAERMASLCIREHDEEVLKMGIYATALSFENLDDIREAITALGLLYNSAVKLSVSPEKTFERIWQVVPDSEEFLRKFLSRDADKKSLKAMLYMESSDENGFLYVSTW